MPCNCNNNNNGCGCTSQTTVYNRCSPTPCTTPTDCECPTILKSDCVIYSGNDLPCSEIPTGTILTELIEQLDAFICEKVNDITNALTLRNIGTGSEVYKGVDLLGRKEIRKINALGTLATVTQNTNDISISINETNLDTFIEANQKTYTLTNNSEGKTMDNRITRQFEDQDIIIYQRCGSLKTRGFLSKYFEYDVKKNKHTGREFKSTSQVVSYLKKIEKI